MNDDPHTKRVKEKSALVIHGAADAGIPLSAGEALSETLPNAELVVVEGACHAVNLTHPEATNQAIADFLESTIQ